MPHAGSGPLPPKDEPENYDEKGDPEKDCLSVIVFLVLFTTFLAKIVLT